MKEKTINHFNNSNAVKDEEENTENDNKKILFKQKPKNNLCIFNDVCNDLAVFNYDSKSFPAYCSNHKTENMIQTYKKCG